jgi:hypothetical protein
MGHDPPGRRHASPAWLDLASGSGAARRGRKLVVQLSRRTSREAYRRSSRRWIDGYALEDSGLETVAAWLS